MSRVKLYIGLTLFAALVTVVVKTAPAQSQQEIKPYQFGEFDVAQQLNNGQLYKVVHEGCELYVAVVGKYDQSPSVSITTGRGCK